MSDREILELLLTKVSSVEDKTTVLDGKITALDDKMATLDGRITALDDRITTLDGRITALDGRITTNEISISNLNKQLKKSTAELKAMDSLILDEVERVHTILDRHKEDQNAHSA